jgi:hypothetical protein
MNRCWRAVQPCGATRVAAWYELPRATNEEGGSERMMKERYKERRRWRRKW